jgi:hypothetical protein
MIARIGLVIAAVVVTAIVSVVWIYPIVSGPYVDCGDLEPAACEDVLARVVNDQRWSSWLPITAIYIYDAIPGERCGSFYISRWGIFDSAVTWDCL